MPNQISTNHRIFLFQIPASIFSDVLLHLPWWKPHFEARRGKITYFFYSESRITNFLINFAVNNKYAEKCKRVKNYKVFFISACDNHARTSCKKSLNSPIELSMHAKIIFSARVARTHAKTATVITRGNNSNKRKKYEEK